MNTLIKYIFLAVVLSGLMSCTANKFLPEGKKYYDGASVDWNSKADISSKDKRATLQEVQSVIRPDPNVKFLGMRPKAWFFHIAGDVEKEKGFKHWLKYKIGGKPVYLEDVDVSNVNRLIRNRLVINGFFQGRSRPEIKESKYSAHIVYQLSSGKPYAYDTIAPIEGEGELVDSIRTIQQSEDRVINVGQRYDFDDLQNERARIESDLKNEGFYKFDQRLILFRADSTVSDSARLVAIYPKLKESLPAKAAIPYTIESVTVHDDYLLGLEDSTLEAEYDSVMINDITYRHQQNYFRPEIIVDQVQIHPGDRYSRFRQLNTINRLVQLDVYRIVNVEYKESGKDKLHANIYVSPYKKKSLQLELSAVTTSQSFAGPHLKASFRNRNFLRGAERYELSLTGSYEWQIGGHRNSTSQENSSQNVNLLNNFEIGLNQSLLIPRLITPFNIDYSNSRYIPQTRFDLSFKWQRRVGYYQFNSAEANYGFLWRETMTKRHNLFPVSFTFIRLGQTTEEFQDILEKNEYLRRSLDDQFILGTNYSYFYSTQEDPELSERRNNFYFNGNLGLAGNLLYLSYNALGVDKQENISITIDDSVEPADTIRTVLNQYEMFGLPFAQYVRVETDFRHYFDFDKNNRLVSRLVMGVGFAYGNSKYMPYSKQFAVGGASSLRGFRPRSIGPGAYPGDSTVSFVDQTGEIRLEFNTEWRFAILNQIKGAIFFDIGNIWNVEEDINRPGGQFKFNRFLGQLAMNTGVGVRYDADIFVLRFDLGIPLRVPYQSKLDRSPVLNIAIGYPF